MSEIEDRRSYPRGTSRGLKKKKSGKWGNHYRGADRKEESRNRVEGGGIETLQTQEEK